MTQLWICDACREPIKSVEDHQVLAELIELTKRIQVQSYDQARLHINGAISDGVFEPNAKPGFYTQYQLNRITKWAASSAD